MSYRKFFKFFTVISAFSVLFASALNFSASASTSTDKSVSTVQSSVAGVIMRDTIKGMYGTFYDPVITENVKDLQGNVYTFGTFFGTSWVGGKNAAADTLRCLNTLSSIQKVYNCKIKVLTLDPVNYLKISLSPVPREKFTPMFLKPIAIMPIYM